MLKMRCVLSRLNASRVILLAIATYAVFLLYVYNRKLHDIRSHRKDKFTYLKHKQLKYILQWTARFSAPFDFMGAGNSIFVKNNCKHRNCFVTDDSDYFADQTEFDAIVFNGRDVIHLWPFQFPTNRDPRQKYIFGAMESPDNFPACDESLDGFFNWTWTYKLDSDLRWGYVTVYDLNGSAVGPAVDMKWPPLNPTNDDVKAKLSSKSKAAAWLVSHCNTVNFRELYVKELQQELSRYGWFVDVYGKCGDLKCAAYGDDSCFKQIEKDYYFYLSFENSFSEDYVTEKLLIALNNYAVPIVFGSADYTRFLPPGSYLNARELGAKELARRMSDIIGNSTEYHDFFRWRNHYVYKETSSTEDVCRLCEAMNDGEKVARVSVWTDFRRWWNGEQYWTNCKS